MTDQRSTASNRIGVTDMTELQQALVAAHIADLERDAAAIRAEREREHLREHLAAGTEATDHRADLPSGRVRLGRWLVSVGKAISGSTRPTRVAGRAMASSFVAHDDPCDENADRLAPAA